MWTEEFPTAPYLRLDFRAGGRERPMVDCWGLHRLIVGEVARLWLPVWSGVTSLVEVARTLRREESEWIRLDDWAERPLDLVLMRGQLGEGDRVVSAPLHVGTVVRPGIMIHIEEGAGVSVQAFRDIAGRRARSDVARRVLGVYRARALA